MAWIDWERVATGIEKAGGRWSASIMKELEAGKAEERAKRLFTFKLGEETEARKELLEEGNRLALELEEGKAALSSRLQSSLGSLELESVITQMSRSGEPAIQLAGMGTRDLIGKLQRFERPTPQDTQLLQSLPQHVQAPIATAMGAVSKYYQKQDFEEAKFKKMGEYYDAQIEHWKALASALRYKAAGRLTPQEATKLLDTSTKALAALQKDEYFRLLSMKVSGKKELKPEEQASWNDYMIRYAFLHGSIKAANEILSGKPTPRPTPTVTPEVEPEEIDFLTELEQSKFAGKAREILGVPGKFIYDLLTKGSTDIKDSSVIGWFKKVIKGIEAGEWEEPIK